MRGSLNSKLTHVAKIIDESAVLVAGCNRCFIGVVAPSFSISLVW